MDRGNFIQTANPFNLRTPPGWFLARLHAYDTELVIFPSEKEPVYRMGRRGRYGHGLLTVLKDIPDTKVFVDNRVWPWKSVLPESLGMQWAKVLVELPDYDTQRYDDPAGQLDAAEAKIEADLDKRIEDEADQRAAAMWRTLGIIEGSRIGGGSRPEGAGYSKLGTKPRASRRRVNRPVNSGAGALWVGR